MLVTTRKPKESILIGDVKITILSVKGNRVKIGIEAPGGVYILREELINKEPKPCTP